MPNDISEMDVIGDLDHSPEVNKGMFDRYSLVHLATGVWLGSLGMGLIPLLTLHTAFEVVENQVLKRILPQTFPAPSPDSIWNSIGDTIACSAGWAVNLKDRVRDDPWIGNWTPKQLMGGFVRRKIDREEALRGQPVDRERIPDFMRKLPGVDD
jgi:hypothetical protein